MNAPNPTITPVANAPILPPGEKSLTFEVPDFESFQQQYISRIDRITYLIKMPSDANHFVVRPIIRFMKMVFLCPASLDWHHSGPGGLVDHSLEVATLALQKCADNKDMTYMDRLAILAWALCHDYYKVTQMKVTCAERLPVANRQYQDGDLLPNKTKKVFSEKWRHYRDRFEEWARLNDVKKIKIEWKIDRDLFSKTIESCGATILQDIFGPEFTHIIGGRVLAAINKSLCARSEAYTFDYYAIGKTADVHSSIFNRYSVSDTVLRTAFLRALGDLIIKSPELVNSSPKACFWASDTCFIFPLHAAENFPQNRYIEKVIRETRTQIGANATISTMAKLILRSLRNDLIAVRTSMHDEKDFTIIIDRSPYTANPDRFYGMAIPVDLILEVHERHYGAAKTPLVFKNHLGKRLDTKLENLGFPNSFPEINQSRKMDNALGKMYLHVFPVPNNEISAKIIEHIKLTGRVDGEDFDYAMNEIFDEIKRREARYKTYENKLVQIRQPTEAVSPIKERPLRRLPKAAR